MRVYLIQVVANYEGHTTIAVRFTLRKAMECLRELTQDEEPIGRFSWYCIETWDETGRIDSQDFERGEKIDDKVLAILG